ncbi:MAG: hypothetical protein ACTHOH_10985, partial [Lysobacteraceae bacterium]
MHILRMLPLAIRLMMLGAICVALGAAGTAVLARWLPDWGAALVSALVAGALLAQGVAERVVRADQFDQVAVLVPGDAEAEVAVAVAGDGAGEG